MQAVVFTEGEVRLQQRPDPVAGPNDVLVEVAAAGINGADVLQRAGNYPAPGATPDDQPGLEFAGEVRSCGADVVRWQPGDLVMGIVVGAGQAQLVATHEDLCQPVPAGLDLREAGGLPEAMVTAHDALFGQASLATGERVLVTGAAGGVGSIAVQLAAGSGADVVASVRGSARHDAVRALGAQTVVTPDQQADAGPYDVVLELVGAPSLATVTTSLAVGARVVVIGVGAGPRIDLNLLHLMGARATLRGSTLRARPLADRIVASRRAVALATSLHERGALSVPIAASHQLADASAAYDVFTAGGTVGKVLLTP